MLIKARSYAYMRRYTAHLPNDGELEIADHATVADVLRQLGVPGAARKILLVNGRPAQSDRVLQAGDRLVFYPLLEGG